MRVCYPFQNSAGTSHGLVQLISCTAALFIWGEGQEKERKQPPSLHYVSWRETILECEMYYFLWQVVRRAIISKEFRGAAEQ